MSIRKLGLMAVLLAIFGMGCLWDSDTLAQELKGLPELPDIIAGRFERNPELFYEMRIERIEKAVATGELLDPIEFFDIAVSLDKLGRQSDAIKCIEERLEGYMSTLNWEPTPEEHADFEYKRLANLGTFYIHRGIKQAEAGLPDIRKGLSLIEKAIVINPDAHFGREVVQVDLVKDLIWELEGEAGERPELTIPKVELRKGLLGIVTLGGAWENPKVWSWIAGTLNSRDGAANSLITLRLQEFGLQERIYDKFLPTPLRRPGYRAASPDDVEREYKLLRENGDKWQKNRTDFMMAKLKNGDHPDTNPKFWDGYEETPKYAIQDSPLKMLSAWFANGQNIVPTFFVTAVLAVIGLYVWSNRRKKVVSKTLR